MLEAADALHRALQLIPEEDSGNGATGESCQAARTGRPADGRKRPMRLIGTRSGDGPYEPPWGSSEKWCGPRPNHYNSLRPNCTRLWAGKIGPRCLPPPRRC